MSGLRQQFIDSAGQEIGELCFLLWNELTDLHRQWNDFRTLYSDTDTLELLNDTAPDFFGRLQSLMLENIQLRICRLTDPPTMKGGKKTLTVRQIQDVIPDSQFRKDLAKLTRKVLKAAGTTRKWRNTRLAHRGLPPLDGATAEEAFTIKFKDIQQAMDALTETMNFVQKHYVGSTTSYKLILGAYGVDNLLFSLKTGKDAYKSA